jgi:hypothetical protein
MRLGASPIVSSSCSACNTGSKTARGRQPPSTFSTAGHLTTDGTPPAPNHPAASSDPRRRPHAPWSVANRVVFVLCSQRRAEDRLGTPAAFDVLHRWAPHHRRNASGTESPSCHLLQHPAGVLLLTTISSDASGLPSGVSLLSTPAARPHATVDSQPR